MEWIRDNAWQSWLALSIILAVAELASMELILLMLAAGALAGMFVALVGLSGVAQVLVAAAAAVAFLALIRPPILRRLHSSPAVAIGIDRLAGKQATVLTRITGLEVGRVQLDGETWSATPAVEDAVFVPGQTVEVVEIRGTNAVIIAVD